MKVVRHNRKSQKIRSSDTYELEGIQEYPRMGRIAKDRPAIPHNRGDVETVVFETETP
jgi:hypothetical protein